MDTCLGDLCNNGEKAELRSQSKCEQDKKINKNPVYPFSMDIYKNAVDQCLFCNNCSLTDVGKLTYCDNGENVCEVNKKLSFGFFFIFFK
jgi:hypothetical protein